MARVEFTEILRRHVEAPPTEVPGDTVRAVLAAVFAQRPALRSYVLDDQGEIRKHVAIFVDGHRTGLDTPVGLHGEVFVMQALSGG